MSGRTKFSELTKHFTVEDRKAIEEEKHRLRASLQPPQNKNTPAPSEETQAQRNRASVKKWDLYT